MSYTIDNRLQCVQRAEDIMDMNLGSNILEPFHDRTLRRTAEKTFKGLKNNCIFQAVILEDE